MTTRSLLCPGHHLEAALWKVKKEGPNKGKWFYACPCPRGFQCNFFLWKEEETIVYLAQIAARMEEMNRMLTDLRSVSSYPSPFRVRCVGFSSRRTAV